MPIDPVYYAHSTCDESLQNLSLCLLFFSSVSSVSWFPLFAFFLPFVPSPHQPVPANHEPAFRQPLLPSLARADRGRLVEQPVVFLLPGQSGELGHECVLGREERFLAVERSSRFLRVLGDIANRVSLVLG